VILVTGGDSSQGRIIVERLLAQGFQTTLLSVSDCQQTAEQLEHQLSCFSGLRLIVHAFELGDVRKAEHYPDLAHQFNVRPTEVIGEYAAARALPVIFLSSFLVFDGFKKNPYIAANSPSPVSSYGRSKALAEKVLLERNSHSIILRTGWLLDLEEGGWLDRQIVDAVDGLPLLCSAGHFFNPTTAQDIASVVVAVIRQVLCNIDVWGVYHYGGNEPVSHAELVQYIGKTLAAYLPGLEPLYEVCPPDLSPLPPVRLPENGVLGCIKLRNTFGIKQKSWRQELPAMLSRRVEKMRTPESGGDAKDGETLQLMPLAAEGVSP